MNRSLDSKKQNWIYKPLNITVVILSLSALIFAILNSQWLIAQLHYRTAKAVEVTHQTNTQAVAPNPNAPASINIPSLQVKAPLVLDEPSLDESKVQLALRKGVLLYGNSARPGEDGHTVIFGHSSGSIWMPGDYKWVFTLLDKLKPGDVITVNYQGIAFNYVMKDSVVVDPYDLAVLDPTDEPMLSLITCTPVGTDKNRLVVRATLVR